MNITHHMSKNEEGFVLVTAMVMLVVLTLLGVFALNTTTFELQIAGNDRLHKDTFYKAESGDMLAVDVLENNIYCADGFTTTGDPVKYGDKSAIDVFDMGTGSTPSVRVHGWQPKELAFYLNPQPWTSSVCNITVPDEPTISFPITSINNFISDTNRTDVYLGGSTRKLPGGALQMAAGYERLGKSAAGGGTMRDYDIIARHRGANNSESVVALGWGHMIGMEYGNDAYCK